MLNKLKRILQWFVSVCFVLIGLIYVGEYTVPAIVLMVLAGVIILPPVTKKIPTFKFKKVILIIASMVLLSAGMTMGENNISPEVQAKRAAAAEAAASSKAAMEAQKAAESASRAAKEAEKIAASKQAAASAEAERIAQEKEKADTAAAEKNEKNRKKIDEYKDLILRNYSNPSDASRKDESKFFSIAKDEEKLEIFTVAWREALYETCMSENPIPSDKSHPAYMQMVDVFNRFVNLYYRFYEKNTEGGVKAWIPEEYNLSRNIGIGSSSFDKVFNNTYKGFIKPQSNYPEAYTSTFYISQKLSNSTGNNILDAFNKALSDGSSEWVGYKGGLLTSNDNACVLVTPKGTSFSEAGNYRLTYVDSEKTTTLTDSKGFEIEADIYYVYDSSEFSEAYEKLYATDEQIAEKSNLIFEFLESNENYKEWQNK